MIQNIDKVTQRGDKLEDLGERAGEGLINGRRGGEGEGRGQGWEVNKLRGRKIVNEERRESRKGS